MRKVNGTFMKKENQKHREHTHPNQKLVNHSMTNGQPQLQADRIRNPSLSQKPPIDYKIYMHAWVIMYVSTCHTVCAIFG